MSEGSSEWDLEDYQDSNHDVADPLGIFDSDVDSSSDPWKVHSDVDQDSDDFERNTDSDWESEVPPSEFKLEGPPPRPKQVKDSGWAWMCVLGSFVVQMLCIGGAKSFGVLFVEFVEKFQCKTESAVWISALNGFIAMSLGPFSTSLGMRYTNRAVVMVGGLCLCTGFVLSAYASSIEMLYGTYGGLIGVGMGLSFAPSIVILSQYFEKRRAFANGLAVSGAGVGNFAIPPLYRYLIDNFGLKGSLMIYGGITLHVCVCGALMRPTENPTPQETTQDQYDAPREQQSNDSSEESVYQLHQSYSGLSNLSYISTPSWAETSSEYQSHYTLPEDWPEETCCCIWCYNKICFLPSPNPNTRGRPLFNCSLMRQPLFHIYFWAIFFASLGYPSVFIMLPPSAADSGIPKDRAALLVSMIGVADLVGRILFGWIADFQLLKRKHGFFLMMALSGATCAFLPITASSFVKQIPVCVVFGLFGGSYIALTAVVLVEALGQDALPNAFGLSVLGQGFAMLMAFPLMGYLRSLTGSWDLSFYTCAAFILIGASFALIEPLAARKTHLGSMKSHSSEHLTPALTKMVIGECVTQV